MTLCQNKFIDNLKAERNNTTNNNYKNAITVHLFNFEAWRTSQVRRGLAEKQPVILQSNAQKTIKQAKNKPKNKKKKKKKKKEKEKKKK